MHPPLALPFLGVGSPVVFVNRDQQAWIKNKRPSAKGARKHVDCYGVLIQQLASRVGKLWADQLSDQKLGSLPLDLNSRGAV
jgi:hypothetical protein